MKLKLNFIPLFVAALVALPFVATPNEPWAARFRLSLFEEDFRANLPATPIGQDLELILDNEFDGSMLELWRYLRHPLIMERGHRGWEKVAIKTMRKSRTAFGGDFSAFQTPTCAPSAFPGAVGYGKNTLRCTLRDPVYRPITTLESAGLPNGNTEGACDSTGSMAPGGFACESGARTGFRLVMPEIVGTYGIDSHGNALVIESSNADGNHDSLVWIGRPLGGASGDRYDLRAASYRQSSSAPLIDLELQHAIWAHSTIWDEECTGVDGDCSPSEQKIFRCANGAADADSIYVYSVDLIGNSGDDIATFGCSYSTMARTFLGPAQRGGTQSSCMTGGAHDQEQITFADGGCFRAGHRTPLMASKKTELVNWAIIGWDSRSTEFSHTACCAELNLRSVLYMPGKVTDNDKHAVWFLFRVNSLWSTGNLLYGAMAADSNWYKLDYNKVAIDTIPNDGSFDIHAATYSGDGPTASSLWNGDARAVCDRRSALGGDTTFPCLDSAGRTIDSLTFAADSTLDTSDYSRLLDGSAIHTELIVNKNVGNRWRIACDLTVSDSLDHNIVVNNILEWTAGDTVPASIPGSFPNHMDDWISGYPTGTDMAADSSTTSYTPCAKNANDVPSALANRLVAAYGGTANDYDWGDDSDGDGYELWRELILPTDPTAYNETDGSESTASATYGDGRRIYLVPLSVIDTVGTCPTACVIRRRPSGSIINFRTLDSAAVVWNDTTALVITRNNIATATQLDSAQADSVCVVWGRCHAEKLKTMPIY